MSDDFRDRPSMLDADGHRIPLFPAEVDGFWRRWRTVVQAVLIVVFLVLPWVQINGQPAVLIDITHGRLALFGLKLWAHDGPLLFPVLGIVALSLALMTALFGRVWCGWACPQTVFLDGVIRRIESWTEGNHLQRRALAQADWSLQKLLRKGTKWLLFILFCALLTHSFLAYFFGADRVLEMISRDPRENWAEFMFIVFVTGLMLFDLGWFREQFCLIVCPYGRIQSVLMDRHTITVQYDAARGEPRKTVGDDPSRRGACVSCLRCVNVCPTGIDIRNGIQMECIGCTACIDACDEIMDKVGKPRGLIAYRASTTGPVRWVRLRIILYGVILIALALSLAFVLRNRRNLDVTVLRATGLPYFEIQSEDGPRIANSYKLHLHNQSDHKLEVGVRLVKAPQDAVLRFPGQLSTLNGGESRMLPFLVEIPKRNLDGASRRTLRLQIENETAEVEFVSPLR